VRTYVGLIRHLLSSRLALYFLAAETQRFRGGGHPQITLEQLADAANALATALWKRSRHAPAHIAACRACYQDRNQASYRSRRKRARRSKRK